jgi:hypothetical protein
MKEWLLNIVIHMIHREVYEWVERCKRGWMSVGVHSG